MPRRSGPGPELAVVFLSAAAAVSLLQGGFRAVVVLAAAVGALAVCRRGGAA